MGAQGNRGGARPPPRGGPRGQDGMGRFGNGNRAGPPPPRGANFGPGPNMGPNRAFNGPRENFGGGPPVQRTGYFGNDNFNSPPRANESFGNNMGPPNYGPRMNENFGPRGGNSNYNGGRNNHAGPNNGDNNDGPPPNMQNYGADNNVTSTSTQVTIPKDVSYLLIHFTDRNFVTF